MFNDAQWTMYVPKYVPYIQKYAQWSSKSQRFKVKIKLSRA